LATAQRSPSLEALAFPSRRGAFAVTYDISPRWIEVVADSDLGREKSMSTLLAEASLGFVLGCLVLGLNHGFDVDIYDEGLALYGSLRVANGELPYRDFWTVYGPGSLYLNALAFHFFGPSIDIVRHIWLALKALLGVEVLLLGRALGGRTAGWLAFTLTVSHTLAVNVTSGHSSVPALATGLAAILALGVSGSVRVAGFFAGLTGVFRPDFGLYTLLALVVGSLFAKPAKHRPAEALNLFGTVAAVVVPAYGILMLAAGIAPMIQQLLIFPLSTLPRHVYLQLNLPFVISALAFLVVIAFVLMRHQEVVRDTLPIVAVMLGVMVSGLLNYARFRLDAMHQWPTIVCLAPLIAAAPFLLTRGARRMIGAVAVSIVLGLNARRGFQRLSEVDASDSIPLQGSRSNGITIARTAAPYNDLITAVKSRTRPDEPIFSGSTEHGRLVKNDVIIYFVAGRPAANAYHELNPGMITTAEVQRRIIRSLEERHVAVAVLLNFSQENANRTQALGEATLLDDHIRRHFHVIGRFGRYELWQRDATETLSQPSIPSHQRALWTAP
jgi:hypothetical protein